MAFGGGGAGGVYTSPHSCCVGRLLRTRLHGTGDTLLRFFYATYLIDLGLAMRGWTGLSRAFRGCWHGRAWHIMNGRREREG